MKSFKLPGVGDLAKVKVYALFGQPQKFPNVDGTSIPPLPSLCADTYWGTDMGVDLNSFLWNFQSITYNPNIAGAWGSEGWDGTFQPDMAVMHTPEYQYNKLMSLKYNRGSDPNYWMHPGGANQFGTGWNGLGYQTNWPVNIPYDHSGQGIQAHTAAPVDPMGALQGQGGSMSQDWHVQQTQGYGILGNIIYGPKPTYEYWRGGIIPSSIPAHNDSWSAADNGDSRTTAGKDYQNYSKCISKILICEADGELLNGYLGCAKLDPNTGDCAEWAYLSGSEAKKRILILKPKGLWSQEIGFGPDPEEPTECHTYEGEDGFIPIQPPYEQDEWITVEKLQQREIVTTNPILINQLYSMGCSDDIVAMDYMDSQGNQTQFYVAYASWRDNNAEARKRASGLGGDFEEECIILCDAEGNEREGVILFREEDCSDDINVEVTTPTTPPPTSPPPQQEHWYCTGPGDCVKDVVGGNPAESYATEQQCLNNCGGGGGGGGGGSLWECQFGDGCVESMNGTFNSLLDCQRNCGGGGGADPCPGCQAWQFSGYSSQMECYDDHCNTGLDMGCCVAGGGNAIGYVSGGMYGFGEPSTYEDPYGGMMDPTMYP
jgi:hypothetical protein